MKKGEQRRFLRSSTVESVEKKSVVNGEEAAARNNTEGSNWNFFSFFPSYLYAKFVSTMREL